MSQIESAQKVANNLKNFSLNLAETDIEAALSVASIYGKFLSANYIGILADSEFELQLGEYFSSLLNDRVKQINSDTLHLMTTGYSIGGHTRVVERFLKAGAGDGLLVLDRLPKDVLNKIPKHILVFNGIRKPCGVATISEIVAIGLKFNNIILHIHPDDIYSAIAAILLAKLGVKVFMYNHADHLFSFGYAAAEKVFEISKYGWIRGATRNIEHKQSFVGIPIPILDLKQNNSGKKEVTQIFMAGHYNKFVPWGEYSVPEFINQFYRGNIVQDRVKFIICGPTGKEKYWRTLEKNIRQNVDFLGPQPHKKYMELLETSDCYVDSFPQGNGTGFLESVMLGIPSFGLGLMAGYSYAEILKSNTVPDLITALSSHIKNKNAIDDRLQRVREKVINEQSINCCVDRLRISMEDNQYIPLPEDLRSMRCMDNFYEQFWPSQGDIYIEFVFRRLFRLKISTKQKIYLLKCTINSWPYAYRSFFSALYLFLRNKLGR